MKYVKFFPLFKCKSPGNRTIAQSCLGDLALTCRFFTIPVPTDATVNGAQLGPIELITLRINRVSWLDCSTYQGLRLTPG